MTEDEFRGSIQAQQDKPAPSSRKSVPLTEYPTTVDLHERLAALEAWRVRMEDDGR